MAKVNRTPFGTVPEKWAFDPEIGPFVQELLDEIRQLRIRTGADDDHVERNDFFYQGREAYAPPDLQQLVEITVQRAIEEDGIAEALSTAAYANALAGSRTLAGVPIGGVIIWPGPTIPEGWAICDGTGGTPDLRDRFVLAAGTTYSLWDTGGAETDTSGVPSATTTVDNDGSGSTVAVGSDTHTHEVDIMPPYYTAYYIQRVK